MKQKTFILGVGAQKAGTSWLRGYLDERPDSDMGFTKEYHIFDALTLNASLGFKKQVFNNAAKIAQLDPQVKNPQEFARLFAFLVDPNLYFDYFVARLWHQNTYITGDFTPAYAGLDEEALTFINTQFQNRGITVKPIFIMRDPVQRLRSMVLSQFKKQNAKPNTAQLFAEMEHLQKTKWESLRSDYKSTIQRLENVFGENVFFGFYENLFSKNTIVSLCDFLQVEYHEPDFHRRINANDVNVNLTESEIQSFRMTYRETYSFVTSHFRQTPVPELWQQ